MEYPMAYFKTSRTLVLYDDVFMLYSQLTYSGCKYNKIIKNWKSKFCSFTYVSSDLIVKKTGYHFI